MSFVITTNFSGLAKQGFTRRLYLTNQSVEQNLVNLVESPSELINLKTGKLTNNNVFSPGQADFPVGVGSNIALGEVVLQTTWIGIYQQYDPNELTKYYGAEDLAKMIADRELTPEVQALILGLNGDAAAQYLNYLYWRGDTNNPTYNEFDGLVKKLRASSAVNKVVGPTAITTAADALAAIEKVYVLMPQYMKDGPNMPYVKIIVSDKVWNLFQDYQRTGQVYKGVDITQEGIAKYKGIPMGHTSGLYDDTIVAGVQSSMRPNESSFVVGVNAFADQDNVDMGFMARPSRMIFLRADMKIGTQIKNEDQIFMYDYPVA